MALTETSNNAEKKSADSKPPEKKEKPLTKVIIRRLPPNIDQETFLNQVSPVPDYNYIYMVKGDYSLGENAFSRIYINFVCPEDVYNFKERFDNYVFLDQRGHEYPAVVEFAAFQKIPKKRGKIRVDPKSGTVETDPVYQEFVESLNKTEIVEQEEKPEYTLQLTNENKNDVTTPLLEFIKNKRAQRMRVREVRREERKKREMDRKKTVDDRRKYDEKSPMKNVTKSQAGKFASSKEDKPESEATEKVDVAEEKPERVHEKPSSSSSYYKNKEKKYEERRRDVKPKYPPPRKDYGDKREYKRSEDYKERDYRPKYDDYKKENDTTKAYPKKVKKYSEKREERKIEAQKAEQKKLEQQSNPEIKTEELPSKKTEENIKNAKPAEKEKVEKCSEAAASNSKPEREHRRKESESASQRRIRNKDRPTIAIYRPGMLSKKKQTDPEPENKEEKN